MAKIQNISEIHPTLGFTEFDILENYRKSFHESEPGRLHSLFPFECMAKAGRPVGESGVCLQDHKDDLCGRTEYVPAAQTLFRQTCGFCHTLKQKQRMKPAKPTLMKTLAVFFQNIKFCKAQSRVNF